MTNKGFEEIFYSKVEEIERGNIDYFKSIPPVYLEDEHGKLKRHFSLYFQGDTVYIKWTERYIPEYIKELIEALPKSIIPE